ncbi:MAG TPA: menaquinone biosynthesis decarboxylase [Gemmatimonadales bacterium]|nr:menaquinone biosynthesis decarboxylase [Gemmatimonadales bacterium]
MALDSLRAFIGAIEAAGDLVRVQRPVSVDREITEIADRCMKSPGGGPALLFTSPTLLKGGPSRYPVAVNLFGSEKRMALALGVECLDTIGERIAALLNLKVPDSMLGKLALLPQLAEVAKFPPRTTGGRPPCQEVVIRAQDVDLSQFPVPVCWPEDGGPYITLPGVITRDPVSGVRNVGMYRIQVLGKAELAMHWQRHKVGAAHWREMAARGERMPVAIALGGDPASVYAASAPLPPSIDEFLFAGFLRKEPVRLAKAMTSDLDVPAEAELVLEGYVDPREALVLEGPFGDHTGFYSLADHYPKVHVTAVTMRAEPIWPHTIVGRPPMEDYYLGHATERIFLPLLKLTIPEMVDIHMPAEGIFHNLVFVSIDKQYPGQAYKVMNGLWGQGLMSLAKVIVVVDKDVNVRDAREAWWVALNHIDPERDVRFTLGPIDVLDHSSRGFTFGSKMGIDATRKWKEEGFTREWPSRIVMDPETQRRVDAMWEELGIEL